MLCGLRRPCDFEPVTLLRFSIQPNMRVSLTSIPVEDPIAAHRVYTELFGFKSERFEPEAELAVVTASDGGASTSLLLEPMGAEFVRDFQKKVYDSGLPIIVFGVDDLPAEVERLKQAGLIFREDLANPDWEMENLFEDSCGNIVMLQANEKAS